MSAIGLLLTSLVSLAPASGSPEPPGSHLWVVNEVFSNADGSVQFVELWECCGSAFETFMAGKDVFTDASTFTFPVNLQGNTAHRHLLLGTAAFAALPGAPAPDFIIPSNFLALGGDTVRWHIYPDATLVYGPGELPLNGFSSLHRSGLTGINSPTNFAGLTGAVNVVLTPAMPWRWLAALAVVVVAAGTVVLRRVPLPAAS